MEKNQEMVIQCENCKRKYRLDDSRIKPPGSSVRCSKCGHIFFVSKTDDLSDEDKLGISEESPLFEDLREEIATEERSNDYLEKEEPLSGSSSDLTQAELNIRNDNEETDNDILDIPTEHQENLEDLIDDYITENTATNLQSEELPTKEIEEIENKVEISEIEEADDSIQNPPKLFESEDSIDNRLDDNEVHDEVYADKSFEEDYDDGLPIENIDSISIEEETPDEENPIIEDIDQENLEEAENEISHNASGGTIIKSHTGIITRFIYTLITIAALFVIFIASLIILIKAEILPESTLSTLT
ncbi:MAG: zinc-ribbon domain-containing protein, partial [Thermodesulfobacteriota bacterium]